MVNLSFQSSQHTYGVLMAQDVLDTLQHLGLERILIGHSMGGKVAMKLGLPKLKFKKLVVLDMAPVAYGQRRHDNVFAN